MKKISIVIPAHNEEDNVALIHQRIKEVFAKLDNYIFEIIFVNDGSRDQTQAKLEELSSQFEEVKFIEFSRNFGHQPAVKAGMDCSNGNAVISMDADLQHPPELIPDLIKKWEEGFDIIYTIRTYPKQISAFKRRTSILFYHLLSTISDVNLVQGGGSDFRLMDSSVVDVVREMNETDIFLRGLSTWVGFRQIGVPYIAAQRASGESSYNLNKMVRFAFTGITAFSVKPLYLAAYLGFIFSVFAVLGYVIYVIHSFVTQTEISGWASLIMTVVFFGGLQLIILGIIGMYLGKIFKQVKERPNYIIRSKNF
ncbi:MULTISPECIES: glycosyltransferase family 2 protein [unclassified Kaistella]|uniref:glycosyltransferase family 2 protein n=1 Tax=unclassified Kaistella TaxID=2762626 RepID=UPI002732D3D2|nr:MULTISPECIES: glycosyltransferase family 2 protein [unclassified Kaistella]MCZ2084423.1 glycosyltransferase family 2 protein [Flavobacteriales bacterium]MDP2454781.1 glycosyltransferase family 2 protein [Kaistella sp. SH11-4b]MDP2457518.1 glycosyltransferase family 2 protein [Kaistella sp. SH40-3]MDP2460278.1 glycosyltransferase family 2 protein [Kaistella sp. SH19-2b]